MKIINNFLGYSLNGVIVLLINAIIIPIQTRVIEIEDYGRISYFITIANFIFNFSLLGLDRGYVRYFYTYSKNKTSFFKKIISYPLICAIFIFILLFFYIPNKLSVIFLCVHVLALILIRFYILKIRMEEEIKLYSKIEIFKATTTLIIPTCLYYIFHKINVYYLGLILSDGLLVLISFKNFNTEKGCNFSEKYNIKEIIKYSFPLMGVGLLAWCMTSIDKLFLKKYSTLLELGYYSIAFKIISILEIFKTAFINFWNPLVYKENKNKNEVRNLYSTILKVVIFFSFLGGFMILLFSDLIILILGEKFRESLKILYPLTLVPILGIISEITYIGINLEKKSYYNLYISIIIIIYNMFGNYFFVKNYGAQGVAIVTATTYILYFLLRTIYGYKFYKIELNRAKLFIILLVYCINCFFNNILKNKQLILYLSFFIFLFLQKEVIKEIYIYVKKLIFIGRTNEK